MAENTAGRVTRGSVEDRVKDIARRYHREQQGHEPTGIRVRAIGDMIVVHSSGIFTPTEQSLADSEEGRKLVKSARRELRSLTRKEIERSIGKSIGCGVIRSFWDVDIRCGDQIEVYMLDEDLDQRLLRDQIDALDSGPANS